MTDRSEDESGAAVAVPLTTDSASQSAGQMLRQAREAMGLHVAVVAATLKVPPQKIMALEVDDFGALPDPVFARSLAASVCRVLRIDPAPVLARMPEAPRVGGAGQIALPQTTVKFRSEGLRSASGLHSRRLLILVVVLLLGAGVLLWLPQSVFDRIDAQVTQFFSPGAGAGEGHEALDGASAASTPDGMAVEPVQPAAPMAPAAASTAAQNGAAAGASPVSAAAPAQPAAADPAPTDAREALVVVARQLSWVSVLDADGKALLRRELQAGETARVSGALPLSVVIGRASAVTVQVYGKPVDLAPLTRGGGDVARFEIQP